MFTKAFITLLALGSIATAAPNTMDRRAATRKLIIGGPTEILTADFDGSSFKVTGQNVTAGSAPSWLRFNSKTNTLYAVNENGASLNVFTLDAAKSKPSYVTSTDASAGVVFLEFNKDRTRMVGAAYGSGMVDVWDISSAKAPKLMKQITVKGTLGPGQTSHHPHQALLDPSGRFMILPDLGGDQLLVLDTKDDKYEISSTEALFSGAGPRHGGFVTSGSKTYYMVACELSSKVILYELDYSDATTLKFKTISTQSTYGAAFPPANATTAAAGELAIASNNRDVYISNRLSGNATDSIAHFVFDAAGASLTFADTVSSYGILPRHMSLSADQSLMFVANQQGDTGLVALSRCPGSGSLSAIPVAKKALSELVAPGLTGSNLGPQFVHEI